MSDYTVAEREDAFDIMAEYPGYGEMRSYTEALGAEQVAFTWRTMPACARCTTTVPAMQCSCCVCSVRIEDPVADALTEDDFWPEG